MVSKAFFEGSLSCSGMPGIVQNRRGYLKVIEKEGGPYSLSFHVQEKSRSISRVLTSQAAVAILGGSAFWMLSRQLRAVGLSTVAGRLATGSHFTFFLFSDNSLVKATASNTTMLLINWILQCRCWKFNKPVLMSLLSLLY